MTFHEIISGYMSQQTFSMSYFARHLMFAGVQYDFTFDSVVIILWAAYVAAACFTSYVGPVSAFDRYIRVFSILSLVLLVVLLPAGAISPTRFISQENQQAYQNEMRNGYVRDIEGCHKTACLFDISVLLNKPETSYAAYSQTIYKDFMESGGLAPHNFIVSLDNSKSLDKIIEISPEDVHSKLISVALENGKTSAFVLLYPGDDIKAGGIFKMPMSYYLIGVSFDKSEETREAADEMNEKRTAEDRKDAQVIFEKSVGQ